VWELKTLNYQDLLDLVDGAAIFSAGAEGARKDTVQRAKNRERFVPIEKLCK